MCTEFQWCPCRTLHWWLVQSRPLLSDSQDKFKSWQGKVASGILSLALSPTVRSCFQQLSSTFNWQHKFESESVRIKVAKTPGFFLQHSSSVSAEFQSWMELRQKWIHFSLLREPLAINVEDSSTKVRSWLPVPVWTPILNRKESDGNPRS